MNDEIARHLARQALRIARELQETATFIKPHLQPEESRDIALGIAAAIDTVMMNLIDRPLAARPGIKTEIEASISRYGRLL